MILTPYEVEQIATRVAQGFEGEVLPLEVYAGRVLVTGPYDGDDLDEAQKVVDDGCARLSLMARSEIPF